MDQTLTSTPGSQLNWTSTTADPEALRSNDPAGAGPRPLAPDDRRGRIQPIDAEERRGAEAHSKFLHVTEQGTMVRRVKGRLRVTRQDETLLEVPAVKLQGVLLYGNIQVSSQCLRFLMTEGIWLSFFTRQGAYRGRVQPPAERGGRLRRRQWELFSDPAFRLRFSKAVVRGKIQGARIMASAQAKNRLAETLGEANRTLRESLERVDAAESLDQLRGIEGNAARAWWDLFSRWNSSDMPFDGREKRGADDPVNILLNFTYTMITREIDGLIEAAGLDPSIGFFHDAGDDRPALACDLVEEFRHAIADRFVLRLLNLKIIQVDDFEDDEDRGLRFAQRGIRKYLTHYEKALRGGLTSDGIPAVRQLFLDQLGRLLDAMNGAEYRSWTDPAPAEA